MMNIDSILFGVAREIFENSENRAQIRPKPLPCDSFIARSAMQKAIRRGDRNVALRAAATVMLTNSTVVWRRLLVTALEDLGVQQVGLLVRIAAATERRRFGFRIVDEWTLIARLIEDCCSAKTRCQAVNDLQNLSLNCDRYDGYKRQIANLPYADLIELVTDSARDLVERNIALLTCLGPDHAPWALQRPLAELETTLAKIGRHLHPSLQHIYTWAFRKSRLALAPSSLLLISAEGGVPALCQGSNDDIPVGQLLGEVPAYALDQYTRAGRKAIKDYTATSAAWLSFSSKLSLSVVVQQKVAGELLFRIEGAVLAQRALWDLGRVIFEQSRTVGCFLPQDAVEEGMALVRLELPQLDQFRRHRLAQSQLD